MATAHKTIRRITAGLLALALLPGTLPALAQQDSPIRDQDRTVYQTVYGEKLTSVKRTRAVGDDLSLAKEMMAFALDVPDDPGVRCLIYIDVIELSANASDLALLRKATNLLTEHWPKQDAVSPETLMQLASRSYRGVDRRDRDAQGEHYITLLLDIADQYQGADDPEQATSVYRLASTVARTIGSDQFDPIQKQIKRLAAASQIAQRIEMLELSVKKNPQNSPAAHELVRLLITQRNDVAKASQYVQSTRDEELIDLVSHCTQGIDQANAATAMRVADWHLNLAEDEEDEQALALLQQARQWYARFFSLYSREDALAKRVVEMDNLAQLKIQRLTQDSSELSAIDNNKWTPLTAPPFDVKDHLIHNPDFLETKAGQIAIEDGMFSLPLTKADSYEIRITLTTPEPKEEYEERSIFVQLPVGDDRMIATSHFVRGEAVAKLSHVEEKLIINNAPDRSGKKVQYTIQVSKQNDDTAIVVLYNGRPAATWKGNYEELHERVEDDIRYLPKEKGSIMLISSLTLVTIHAIEYRQRD